MVLGYKNCIDIYGTDYKLKEALSNKEIYKIGAGIYSNNKRVGDIEFLAFVRPDAIFTMKTAFYIYGLTDMIPDAYDLAVDRLSSKTKYEKVDVKYCFQPKQILDVGKTKYKYNGTEINIYDKERLLIELLRYSTKIPFDLYKEVINNYRKTDVDYNKIEDYLKYFKTKEKIAEKIRLEVL